MLLLIFLLIIYWVGNSNHGHTQQNQVYNVSKTFLTNTLYYTWKSINNPILNSNFCFIKKFKNSTYSCGQCESQFGSQWLSPNDEILVIRPIYVISLTIYVISIKIGPCKHELYNCYFSIWLTLKDAGGANMTRWS